MEEYHAACEEAKEKIAKKVHPDRATQRLRNLLGRLASIKFFDPACGSGNFLIITYKRIRELEIMIWQAMREIANMAVLPMSNITLTQFYGIELDSFACDTATLSLWLAEHQMNVKFRDAFGVQPETLPLKPSGQIVCGNACRLDWNTVCPHTPDDEVYIMGNPPYLGRSLREKNHQEDMDFAFEGNLDNYKDLDYISIWFYKAANYVLDSKDAMAAFVTTNSISQGVQVSLLWESLLRLVQIQFAIKSFKWGNNAKFNAAVTCAIIGISNRSKNSPKFIYQGNQRKQVNNISPYLNSTDDVIIKAIRPQISGLQEMTLGNAPKDDGALLLSCLEFEILKKQFPELEAITKRFIGSDEFLNDIRRYCLWITDEDINKYRNHQEIQRRLTICEAMRKNSKKITTQKLAAVPWRFGEVRYKESNAILVPAVSSERREYIPIGYVDKNTIISNSAFAIYDAEKWLFAILTSKMHNLWVRAVGGSLETRIRYSATLCYNTFPFPMLTTAEKDELERLTQNILNIRNENFDMTLGEMYNPETMPDELRETHHQLDVAVERIYSPEPFTSDEERLEHLFKLYDKMTKK